MQQLRCSRTRSNAFYRCEDYITAGGHALHAYATTAERRRRKGLKLPWWKPSRTPPALLVCPGDMAIGPQQASIPSVSRNRLLGYRHCRALFQCLRPGWPPTHMARNMDCAVSNPCHHVAGVEVEVADRYYTVHAGDTSIYTQNVCSARLRKRGVGRLKIAHLAPPGPLQFTKEPRPNVAPPGDGSGRVVTEAACRSG